MHLPDYRPGPGLVQRDHPERGTDCASSPPVHTEIQMRLPNKFNELILVRAVAFTTVVYQTAMASSSICSDVSMSLRI